MSMKYKVVSGALPCSVGIGFEVDILVEDDAVSITIADSSFPIEQWHHVRRAIDDAVGAYMRLVPYEIEIEAAA